MKASRNGTLVDESALGGPEGDGLLEVIALRKGIPRRLAAHLARLRAGADTLGLAQRSDDEVIVAIAGLVSANNLSEGIVRLTLTAGGFVLTVTPPPPLPEPARLMIASTRRDEHSPFARFKLLNDPVLALAKAEADQAGADDAVLLNSQGRVTESASANIFLLVNGGLITPAVSEGAMPGVARADVIRLARAEEMAVTVELLRKASEVFLSSALGIRPVIRIDGEAVGDGEPGLITQLLATRI